MQPILDVLSPRLFWECYWLEAWYLDLFNVQWLAKYSELCLMHATVQCHVDHFYLFSTL